MLHPPNEPLNRIMFNRLRLCLAFAVILVVFGARIQAQTQPLKILRLKLEDFGWQTPPEMPRGEWPGWGSRLVSIDRQGRVLIGFVGREDAALATREHPGLSFRILRFTPEGKLDLSVHLPAKSWFTNGLHLGPKDQLFARANDLLQEMSADDTISNQSPAWSVVAPCPSDCQLSQSPSRSTLIVARFGRPDIDSHVLIDTSSLPARVSRDCPKSGGTITDKYVYESGDGLSRDVRRWPLCEPNHEVELPLDMRKGIVYALSDDAVLLLGTGKNGLRGVDVVSLSGELRFHREMPKGDFVTGTARSDEHGDRFAFVVETWRGGSRLLDVSGKRVARRVLVYTDTGQQLTAVPVSTVHHYDFDFSMSPDGHRLAILDQGVVSIVELE